MTCTMAENTHLHKICTRKYSYAIFYLNLILNTYTDTPDIVYNIDVSRKRENWSKIGNVNFYILCTK
jgi:hypothetical protein